MSFQGPGTCQIATSHMGSTPLSPRGDLNGPLELASKMAKKVPSPKLFAPTQLSLTRLEYIRTGVPISPPDGAQYRKDMLSEDSIFGRLVASADLRMCAAAL
jgi:hypothetical protein